MLRSSLRPKCSTWVDLNGPISPNSCWNISLTLHFYVVPKQRKLEQWFGITIQHASKWEKKQKNTLSREDVVPFYERSNQRAKLRGHMAFIAPAVLHNRIHFLCRVSLFLPHEGFSAAAPLRSAAPDICFSELRMGSRSGGRHHGNRDLSFSLYKHAKNRVFVPFLNRSRGFKLSRFTIFMM